MAGSELTEFVYTSLSKQTVTAGVRTD